MRPLQWLPVVEEPDPLERRFLARSPAAALAEGTFRSVPTMMGINSREGMVLLAGMNRRSLARLLQRVDRDFGLVVGDLPFTPWAQQPPPEALVRQAGHLIRSFFFGRQRVAERTLPVFLDLYSDIIFNIGVREAAALEARWASERPESPHYLYRFSFDGRLGFIKRLMGTTVLPPISLSADSPDMETRRRLLTLWTNFVKYGDPTPKNCTDLDSIQWESNRVDHDFYLDINVNLTLREHIFESRMKFWSDLYRDVLKIPLSW
ncbi:juvenile hormone esterase-like [Thrips palmi]|uniref:Juvenile hormone esterase-like n=1 Tax=Thrips palmi TaxID=161013 RepID=A0A6P8ZXD5_THRPL|nr:juvenile hormone esterase-like [Thrips palmi]